MGKYWYTDANGKRKRTKAGVQHELDKFQSSREARKDRASRNKARRYAMKQGRVHKGDGQEVHHSDSNPQNSSPSNLRVVSRHTNRSKKENSRRRGSRRNRSSWGV